jgi:murein L,D-transpeptidase YafK
MKNGQPFFRVHAFPFRMTDERMAKAASQPWEEFWKNLKEGYDRFEADRVPPEVSVEGGRYVFRAGS